MAPAGFGRIAAADAISIPGVSRFVQAALPYTLANPVTAVGIYATVVSNGHRPDGALLRRLRQNAFRIAPGAAMANRAIVASSHSPRAFFRRQLDYHGPVYSLWGAHDRLVSAKHAEGLRSALPQAKVLIWKRMGHHPQRERPAELEAFIARCCGEARRERRKRRDLRHRARLAAIVARRERTPERALKSRLEPRLNASSRPSGKWPPSAGAEKRTTPEITRTLKAMGRARAVHSTAASPQGGASGGRASRSGEWRRTSSGGSADKPYCQLHRPLT